ncbi:MAG: M23 family metallopeptidase [Patescibacteria group bacterium]
MSHKEFQLRLYAVPIITFIFASGMVGCLMMDPLYREFIESLENPGSSTDQGGYDGVVIDLPFHDGYKTLCTQGPFDTYSHAGDSTELDLDFDTPNGESDIVYAPIGGTAYVHMESASLNFGYHVNIVLGDGTYVVLAHMSDIFVSDGFEVAAGQILGYEGCTGKCSGDHVHIGLHEGDGRLMAEYGESIEVGYFVDNVSTGESELVLESEDFVCGLDGAGETYRSLLPVTNWHPNGTLVKTPDDNNVYLVEDGERRWIESEDVFWDLGYDFSEVVLISPDELDCMDVGEAIDETSDVSWRVDNAYFRDGDIVKEASRSDLYVVSDGMALPIETWDIFLRLGFSSRYIVTVGDGTIADTGLPMGSCSSDYGCIDAEMIETCGGSVAGIGGAENDDDDERNDTDELDTGDTYDDEELPNEKEDTGGEAENEEEEFDTGSADEEESDEPDDEEEELDTSETDEVVTYEDTTVEVCYLPGVTMYDGNLYLDGNTFTYWGSPVADDADNGDTAMCVSVEAESGEEIKLNAWYQTSSSGDVYWAAYNNDCLSIDMRGTVEVDGVSVTVDTDPWSASVWATDPCSIGGDAYFEVP